MKGQVSAAALLIVILMLSVTVGVIILAKFQETFGGQVSSLNNADVEQKINTTFRTAYTGLTIVSVGIVIIAGLGALLIFTRARREETII